MNVSFGVNFQIFESFSLDKNPDSLNSSKKLNAIFAFWPIS